MDHNGAVGAVVVDIGGSGTRIGVSTGFGVADVRRHRVNSIEELCQAIANAVPTVSGVALSVPGFVDGDSGRVLLCRVAPWLEGDLAGAIADRMGLPAKVKVVNDGEAHALALLKEPDVQFGACVVSLGTSVGFGVLDATGRVSRTLSGQNWDIGEMALRTSASNPHVWWALGQAGLDELQKNRGDEALPQFGYRLGAWLVELAVIFQPRTIAISGGNAFRHWHRMEGPVRSELAKVPDYLARPKLIALSDNEPALTGLTTLL